MNAQDDSTVAPASAMCAALIGPCMSVSLSTQVEKALQAFERAAAARPEVMECYLMTGDSDYLLRIVVPDLEAYERFVMDFTKIAGIAQIRSSFALRTVKQGAALPLG